jgi:hypothetical protein
VGHHITWIELLQDDVPLLGGGILHLQGPHYVILSLTARMQHFVCMLLGEFQAQLQPTGISDAAVSCSSPLKKGEAMDSTSL